MEIITKVEALEYPMGSSWLIDGVDTALWDAAGRVSGGYPRANPEDVSAPYIKEMFFEKLWRD